MMETLEFAIVGLNQTALTLISGLKLPIGSSPVFSLETYPYALEAASLTSLFALFFIAITMTRNKIAIK